MDALDTVIAVYNDHEAANNAVKLLGDANFNLKSLSVVGKGYHTDEKVVGFYNVGDRIKLWGSRGAFWGGLWGLLLGGVFVTIPIVGMLWCWDIWRPRRLKGRPWSATSAHLARPLSASAFRKTASSSTRAW